MALTNLVQDAATTHTETCWGNGSLVNVATDLLEGASPNHRDGNDSTRWGKSTDLGPSGSYNHQWQSDHTWATAKHINSIHIKIYTASWAADSGASSSNYCQIWLKISGTWTQIGSNYGNTADGYSIDDSTGWDNVTGIRIYFSFSLWSGGSGYGNSHGRSWLYEVQAWANVYTGTGIKYYDGANVVEIGGDTVVTSAHHFRCYKGSAVMGIPHIVTTDPSASKIRCYHGGTVYAFPKAG